MFRARRTVVEDLGDIPDLGYVGNVNVDHHPCDNPRTERHEYPTSTLD
jgi:hypothetical protein